MTKTNKKAKSRSLSSAYRTTGRRRPPITGSEVRESMTETQVELTVKQALTRYKRNASKPAELEDLRYKLIQARVMQGLLAVEAAALFGYANSSQLSQIESGERPTPKDWKFLRQAAEVYSVSIDWLLDLSPNMESDSKVAHHYALLRGTEGIINTLATTLTTAMLHTAQETQPVIDELERVLTAVDDTAARFEKFSANAAFEDMPGGAPIVAAHQRLAASAIPLRLKLKKFKGIQSYMDEVMRGTLPPIDYLTDRYSQRELGLDA